MIRVGRRTGATPAGGHVHRVPSPLLLPAAVGAAFLVLPLLGVLLRTPWSVLGAQLTAPAAQESLVLSLACAGAAAVLSVVLGVPLAAWLASSRRGAVPVVRALVTVPLVLPPVVAGVALLATFGRTGVLGGPLHDWFGVSVPFTSAAVVLAQTFVAMPFLVVTVEGTMRGFDGGLEEMAATLGASRWYRFRHVTLPAVLPGVVAGTVLAWARALGEFGATLTFAGSLPGTTRTLPLAVYQALDHDPQDALALSLLLVLVSVAVLVALRDRWLGRGGAR